MRHCKLLLQEFEQVFTVTDILLRADVPQAVLQSSGTSIIVRYKKCEGSALTMVKINAGSKVPAKVRLVLCV
jgi:hypothetical protein